MQDTTNIKQAKKRGRPHHFNAEQINEIIFLRQNGATYQEIAHKFAGEDGKLRTTVVSKICKGVDVPSRNGGRGGWVCKVRKTRKSAPGVGNFSPIQTAN